MRAEEFERLFDPLVARGTAPAGFVRWGAGLWFERDGVRAALLRTELRHGWPFALTLVVGHDCLRDFSDRRPAPRSRNPSEWPIKLAPSSARDLLEDGWHYRPSNLAHHPRDKMRDGHVEVQLTDIGRALAATFPAVTARLDPAVMIEQIRLHGEDAWCERRWIDDYETAIA